MTELKEGDQAPQFTGKNQHGEIITLSDFKGKKLILYFYPKDNTPGCTAEACNLNDNFDDLNQKGFHVIGVSPDSETSHQKFIAKYGLRFSLIADTDKHILKLYGAWGEKKMYGKVSEGVLRSTFIINESGEIEKIIRKVDTKEHTQQIYQNLKL
ncbi:peroxiredoxin Q/BCP [Breznakibacter xylanolyticus]|uniref:thioredoxin-dependent peroxiredoxin n=1 Tax=Breznakibacter xylanolyticus TaxID=990 RepID=A0A2W7N0F3_9BACT|nr:thioredoxin-dependent thiol peroxidase [Breznakibacter xylanolyticus]MBN2742584.1 thioredoxin-dependent thiol peroxidase [Marinilabiliaceae bacterium]PZX13550.1 peroxiredoxin Q/BCP [Breznakibacter xylanolyticus]